MGDSFKHVFAPIEIRGVRYKNRIEMSPTSPKFTTEKGYMTTEHINYFRSIARGGAAVITLGNCSVDIAHAQDEPRQVGIDSDDYIPPLSRFTDMCETYGVLAQLEINHSGLDASWDMNRTAAYGPSSQMMPMERNRARAKGREAVRGEEMSIDKIHEIQQMYIEAAWRCKFAGMQSVFVHGGHANLIGQFSSPYYNRRTDEYGGSLENRARFGIEILEGIRRKCGEGFVIEMRLSADEMIPDGMHFDETKEYIKLLDGKADIFNISAGVHTDLNYFKYWSPHMYMPRMNNAKYAAELKKIVKKSRICAVAGITNLENAEKIISEGWADFCAMARPLMADPEMPRKYALGTPNEVRPCTRCNFCGRRIITWRTVACAVNPALGREPELTDGKVRKADKKKKVAVVGAGPGGMEATLTLLERGHDVILFEKEAEIGGNLIAAAAMELKADMKDYLAWITRKVKESGADIRTGVFANADTIRELAPDALVIAVGADPYFPEVPGIDLPHVHWAADADMGKCETGDNIIMVGGGTLGVESAYAQAQKGKNVTVLELLPQIPISVTHGEGELLDEVLKRGGRVATGRRLTAVYPDHVVCTEVGTGKVEEYPCDTVLVAAGLKPRKAVAEELMHVIPETEIYVIGDVVRPRMIGDAVRGGFDAGITI
jgi:2,4-dienoyl-CoA reductase-like NADH-dependent reductase (Old Yellow Enzyme family)/NADPH-dependent 2,4-dienoyl-CoA reductase/sulfur reductase-like enzyme